MHKRVRDSEDDSSSTKKIKLDEKVIREQEPTTNHQATTINLEDCTTSQTRLQYMLWAYKNTKEDPSRASAIIQWGIKAIFEIFINERFYQTELKDMVKFLEINHAYGLKSHTKNIVHHLALNDVPFAAPAEFSQRYVLTVLSICLMIV
jgi:hypothetical protein